MSEPVLEFREELLDGIQIGAVGGQERPFRPGFPDGMTDRLALVAAEIVEHDDTAGPEREAPARPRRGSAMR